MAKKLLILEDDTFLNKVYKKKLVDAGYEIDSMLSGDGVLNTIEAFKPDLILLDIVMPNVDGFEVLELLSRQQASSVPCLVLSNLGQPDDIAKAKKLGAREYLVKSDVSFDTVLKTIEHLL